MKPSVIGFGCGRIASLSTLSPRKEIVATLHEALDKGINFFDTADAYGQGDSERLLGSVFRGQRQRLLLCSKAGYRFGAARCIARLLKPLAQGVLRRWRSGQSSAVNLRTGSSRQDFSPAHLTAALEASLLRLQTEYLDVFLLHSPPAEVISDGAALDALVRLKERGLVRYYGVSCATASDAAACLRREGISVLQLPVSLLETEAIDKVLPLAVKQGVAIVARQPFAGGALFSDQGFLNSAMKIPSHSPAQAALRFVIQLNGVGVVLPGMTNRVHLEENIGALSGPPITPEEVEMLRVVSTVEKEETDQ